MKETSQNLTQPLLTLNKGKEPKTSKKCHFTEKLKYLSNRAPNRKTEQNLKNLNKGCLSQLSPEKIGTLIASKQPKTSKKAKCKDLHKNLHSYQSIKVVKCMKLGSSSVKWWTLNQEVQVQIPLRDTNLFSSIFLLNGLKEFKLRFFLAILCYFDVQTTKQIAKIPQNEVKNLNFMSFASSS